MDMHLGGANTLAQALIDLRAAHPPEEMEKLIAAPARLFDLRPGRCGTVDPARISGVVLHR